MNKTILRGLKSRLRGLLTPFLPQAKTWAKRVRDVAQLKVAGRRGAALPWVVVAVVLLCIFAAALKYAQYRHRMRRTQISRLTGPVATLDIGNGVKLELVRINPGTFMMGSPDGEPEHDLSESPLHRVKIGKPFYMGMFEVTQAQWNVIRGNQSRSNIGDNFPADGISWNDATNWCAEMSVKLHLVVRLPTEAEWEYACRAGTTTAFAYGPSLSPDQANFNTGNPRTMSGKTVIVGKSKPNPWGLFDMHGNVWEWCQDTLHDDYEKAPVDGSAWIDPLYPYNRVRRGGSWSDPASALRSAVRWGSPGDAKEPDMRNDQVGFRVVVEVRVGK